MGLRPRTPARTAQPVASDSGATPAALYYAFPDDTNCDSADDNSETPACFDSIDNDGDGLIDYGNDPDCEDPDDDDEAS